MAALEVRHLSALTSTERVSDTGRVPFVPAQASGHVMAETALEPTRGMAVMLPTPRPCLIDGTPTFGHAIPAFQLHVPDTYLPDRLAPIWQVRSWRHGPQAV